DRTVGEQALTRPDQDREDPEPELVDQVVPQQRLDQVAAAVHLQLRPSSRLSAAIPSAASPSISTELLHSRVGRPPDATCLVASFSGLAPGSSVACGQCAAKMSYVLRPRTMANGTLIASPMICPIRSSQ